MPVMLGRVTIRTYVKEGACDVREGVCDVREGVCVRALVTSVIGGHNMLLPFWGGS